MKRILGVVENLAERAIRRSAAAPAEDVVTIFQLLYAIGDIAFAHNKLGL